MTEVEVNGTSGLDLDISATRAELSSSSTPLRTGSLRSLEERLSHNGMHYVLNKVVAKGDFALT